MDMHPLHLFHFCPKCGSNRFSEHNFKAYKCEECQFVYYFNPSAATVALIFNDKGELLVTRRAHEPAKGTLDLPGGFIDMYETAEEGVAREVEEETGLKVSDTRFLFSLPNLYPYSGFTVHTVDLFFMCTVSDCSTLQAHDDAAETFFVRPENLSAKEFGLHSVSKAMEMILSPEYLLKMKTGKMIR
ncbi:MAG: NUDIX domain-containing protein [Bacteroidales bacterium]|nr:NUDIX domain-containing protein [Bacteroidales bacterium]